MPGPQLKNFSFMSPGVQIREVDQSQMPREIDAIGAVIIGRSAKGPAGVPIKVKSYSHFVSIFGDTVPGGGSGDVYRNGNSNQSPMYGTYAAKAYLRSNVAPLTYYRVLGEESPAGSLTAGAGEAGWKTDNQLNANTGTRGGAIGLWVAPSASFGLNDYSFTEANSFQLAAIWYLDGGSIALKGQVFGTSSTPAPSATTAASTLIKSDDNGRFTAVISGSATGRSDTINFNFDDSSADFIRKKFNTNPTLRSGGDFMATTKERDYWLGESFEQELRDASLTTGNLVGVITGIQLTGSTTGPANMKGQGALKTTSTARTTWIIGQDTGESSTFRAEDAARLFRILGRGHSEWLQRNVKVSITQIRQSTVEGQNYGSFSVVLRRLHDTDNQPKVIERFDNCNLNPLSPNFIGAKIGTKYWAYETNSDTGDEELVQHGVHPNRSKYIRVDVSEIDQSGPSTQSSLPFGYFGPPKFSDVTFSGSFTQNTGSDGTTLGNKFIIVDGYLPESGLGGDAPVSPSPAGQSPLSSALGIASAAGMDSHPFITASMKFPSVRLRNSASDGGLSRATNAYFGMQTTRTATSTRADPSVADPHRLWYSGFPENPVGGAATTGVDSFSYIFTLDDVVNGQVASSGSSYFYQSGSRVTGTSFSATGSNTYKSLLDAGYDSFTVPMWGGFDGFDIRVPDPLYNNGITSTSDVTANATYYTLKKAIDIVGNPDTLDMNMAVIPGITKEGITKALIEACESRGDALAIIDLPDVYLPTHEIYKSDIADRIATTPANAASALSARALNSSYGCTFYPWVQTVDANTAQLVWVPPSVAMLGVLASSEAKSKLWFAPAGFNRGGLSDGAAGIPVVGVTERITSKARDDLYAYNINPIASFPSSGIVVFGQKTLQTTESALDRINVRRLLNFVKKRIAILSTQVLFEQNIKATWSVFKGLVDPFLSNVLTQYGITDYELTVMTGADIEEGVLELADQSDQDYLIDTNTLYAKIKIQPARSIEYIAIDFVITNTGVGFDD